MLARHPQRTRDLLLVCLGVTTGVTDATAFERLGHVFASVITGNLVLLGISAVHEDGKLALFAGCAIAGYAGGVVLAAQREPPPDDGPVWPGATTIALTVDLALLVAFAVLWEVAGRHASRGTQTAELVLVASAMGVQSAAVRRLGQMSTTYLTSTLTGIMESLVVWRWRHSEARSVGIVLMAIGGAALGTELIDQARPWLPAAQLVPLVVVLGVSGRLVLER